MPLQPTALSLERELLPLGEAGQARAITTVKSCSAPMCEWRLAPVGLPLCCQWRTDTGRGHAVRLSAVNVCSRRASHATVMLSL